MSETVLMLYPHVMIMNARHLAIFVFSISFMLSVFAFLLAENIIDFIYWSFDFDKTISNCQVSPEYILNDFDGDDGLGNSMVFYVDYFEICSSIKSYSFLLAIVALSFTLKLAL